MADNKKLAQAIERGFQLQEEYRARLKDAKDAEQALKDYKKKLINDFTKKELSEVKTSLGTAKLKHKDVPQADPDTGGWEAIYGYIIHDAIAACLKNDKQTKALTKAVAAGGNWEILNKRLGERACAERWEAKVKIPGVKQFHVVDLKFGEGDTSGEG